MIIGREKEMQALRKACENEYSQFIVVYGRRRIGKTFLIRETFGYNFTFQHAGIYQGTRKEQLFAFQSSLKDAGLKAERTPENWMEAFELLKDLIRQSTEERKTIFLDELSWMDTHKSDLMKALESFWNGWASGRKDIVLIICSSVTSWMMKKVIHNKGGLYHRLTLRLYLQPFTLDRCEEFAKAMDLGMHRFQILQAYMILGGVPFYWTFLKKELSLSQNIDEMFFASEALLKDEFQHLMSSLFKSPDEYIKIIQLLAGRINGMTRSEIAHQAGLSESGHLTEKLEELEKCGFIRIYEPFGNRKKESRYQLIDAFTIFHYHFLTRNQRDVHFWQNQQNTPRLNAWNGLAFERICLLHEEQIRKALGISGVLTNVCSWSCKANADMGICGSQIDLLLVRRDQVINLLEMKYSSDPYVLGKDDIEALERKRNDLYRSTHTTSSVHLTMVTPFGLYPNAYARDIQSTVNMNQLFEPSDPW